MPPTLEVVCEAPDCPLDMFEAHYTYEMVGNTAVEDLSCPCCGRTDSLSKLTYTYEESDGDYGDGD